MKVKNLILLIVSNCFCQNDFNYRFETYCGKIVNKSTFFVGSIFYKKNTTTLFTLGINQEIKRCNISLQLNINKEEIEIESKIKVLFGEILYLGLVWLKRKTEITAGITIGIEKRKKNYDISFNILIFDLIKDEKNKKSKMQKTTIKQSVQINKDQQFLYQKTKDNIKDIKTLSTEGIYIITDELLNIQNQDKFETKQLYKLILKYSYLWKNESKEKINEFFIEYKNNFSKLFEKTNSIINIEEIIKNIYQKQIKLINETFNNPMITTETKNKFALFLISDIQKEKRKTPIKILNDMFGIDITLLDELYKYHTDEDIYCLNTIKTDKEYEFTEIYKEHLQNIMCPIFQKKEDNAGHIITMEWKKYEKKKEYDSNQLIIDGKYINLQQGQNCLVYSFFALILGNIFKDLKTGYKILIALNNADEDNKIKSKILNKLLKYNKLIKFEKIELKNTLTEITKQNKSLNLEMNFGKLLRKALLNLKTCQKATSKENIEELKIILLSKKITSKEIRRVLLQCFFFNDLENRNFNWINFTEYFAHFIEQLIKIKEDKINDQKISLEELCKFITGNENDDYEQIISMIPYQIGTTLVLPNLTIKTLLTVKNSKHEILPTSKIKNKEIKKILKNIYEKQNIIEIIDNNKLEVTEKNQTKEYNLQQNNEQITTIIVMISMITNSINEAEQIWQKCNFNLNNSEVKNIFFKIFEYCILEKGSRFLLYTEITNLIKTFKKNKKNKKTANESIILLQLIYKNFYQQYGKNFI